MVDKAFGDLTKDEERAVVWLGRKNHSSVREGLDHTLKYEVSDLNALCRKHREALNKRQDTTRRIASFDALLSPEESTGRQLNEDAAASRGRG